MPVIGYLNSDRLSRSNPHLLASFAMAWNEAGYVEGQNVAIEYRWAEGETIAGCRWRLIGSPRVAVSSPGGRHTALAVQAGDPSTIPIVFTGGGGPGQHGFVASLNRPGGNYCYR